jgi:regulation of enolase protein 1 (concanavalin A-like superfamily)
MCAPFIGSPMRYLLLFACFTCAPPAFAAPVPKPTDEEKLKLHWGKVVDSADDCKVRVVKDQLVMSTPGGIRSEVMKDGQFRPLRIEREITGDFRIEVKMIRTTEPSHRAPKSSTDARITSGLFVSSPDMTILFGRQLRADQDKGREYFDHSIWHQYGGSGSRITGSKAAEEVFVRYTRKGNKCLLAHSLDGIKWSESASPKVELPDRVTVGVYLWHDVDQPCEAVFERFKLTPLKAEK